MFGFGKDVNYKYKKRAAEKSLEFLRDGMILGVGTGSTINVFVELLSLNDSISGSLDGIVSSSHVTSKVLKDSGFDVLGPNSVDHIDVYIDGADEIDSSLRMLKGGGGALTGEKILAAMSDVFVCIADPTKKVGFLGEKSPVVIEVIPMARSFVSREICKIGGLLKYRERFRTDYGNQIVDVLGLDLISPEDVECFINNIPGVVTNGIFANRRADVLFVGD